MTAPQDKAKFTPGPWMIGFSDGSGATREDGIWITDGDGGVVAGGGVYREFGVQTMADARLIAAAPDLYAALKTFAACWPATDGSLPEFLDADALGRAAKQACSALARAEGRAS